MKTALAALLCCALVACGLGGQKQTRAEITGSPQERAARATTILSKYCRLPGPIIDAHMAEDVRDNSGGPVPGPSDSSLSGVIQFPAEDVPKWRATLAPALPPETAVDYGGISPTPSWWPGAAAFTKGEFYAPQKLTGRAGGFLVLSPTASAIYFSVY